MGRLLPLLTWGYPQTSQVTLRRNDVTLIPHDFSEHRRHQSSLSPAKSSVPDGLGSSVAPLVMTGLWPPEGSSGLHGEISVSLSWWLWRSSDTAVFLTQACHRFYIHSKPEEKPILSALNKISCHRLERENNIVWNKGEYKLKYYTWSLRMVNIKIRTTFLSFAAHQQVRYRKENIIYTR